MDENFWTHLKDRTLDLLIQIGTKAIYVVITIIIGFFLIRLIKRAINKIMDKTEVELSLQTFIRSLSNFLLYIILVIVVGVVIGIEASAFVTAIGAAGIAIGLALQGSLANFAGGVLILAFKPFKVGDEVVINGVSGEVYEINILYTRVRAWNNRIITMPNGKVSNSDVDNHYVLPERRVEINFHVPYHEDIDEIRELVTSAMKKHPDANHDKPFQLWFNGYEEYSMLLSARCWAEKEIFWGVWWDQMETVKKTLQENGIDIAIPARDIYKIDKPQPKVKKDNKN